MDINLVFYNTFSGREDFEMPCGHILSAVETLDRLQYGTIREREQLYCGVLDNLILENYVYSGGMPVADRSTDPTVYEALRYINDHLAEKIRVPDIAAHVHLSNVGLIWKFRNVLGRTPTEMILVMRMQYAKYLILESRKPLKEIAQLCGYSSPFYFSNTFHKYYGCQPSRCAKLMDGFGKTRESP